MRVAHSILGALGAAFLINATLAQPVNLTLNNPPVDRWMYAFNFAVSNRSSASLFATSGDANGVDTRHAQYLIGFDTFSQLTTNLQATNYLIRKVRLTLTTSIDSPSYQFVSDPTQDAAETYFETNHLNYQTDPDPGRPIEIFGAGFRGGFTSATFHQGSPFGNNAPGQRNAYAAGYSTNGVLVDVGNNVGKTNVLYPHFEVHPFAIGQTTNYQTGQTVVTDSVFTFDFNLADPLVLQYFQEALNQGRVRLMASTLADTGGQQAAAGIPNFATHFNIFNEGPVLEMEATAIRAIDSDNDGLPDDWENFHFGTLAQGANDDFDQDGISNQAEYLAGTNPTEAASALRIVSLRRERNANVLRFTFAAGKQYAMEFSSDLKAWSFVTNPVLTYYAAPSVVEWSDDGSQTGGLASARFYRVRVK